MIASPSVHMVMGSPFTMMRTASSSGRNEHMVSDSDPASSHTSSPEKAR